MPLKSEGAPRPVGLRHRLDDLGAPIWPSRPVSRRGFGNIVPLLLRAYEIRLRHSSEMIQDVFELRGRGHVAKNCQRGIASRFQRVLLLSGGSWLTGFLPSDESDSSVDAGVQKLFLVRPGQDENAGHKFSGRIAFAHDLHLPSNGIGVRNVHRLDIERHSPKEVQSSQEYLTRAL